MGVDDHRDHGTPRDGFLPSQRERGAELRGRAPDGAPVAERRDPREREPEEKTGQAENEHELEEGEAAAHGDKENSTRPPTLIILPPLQSFHLQPHALLMRLSRRILLLLSAALLGACSNPRTEANVAQALNDAALEISGLKNDIADLSLQIDSLRQALAKQDSTIARIAAINGIPIVR